MSTDLHSDGELRHFYAMKNIAVVGMSRHKEKAAHSIPRYMIEKGYNVIPVNPYASQILGRKPYPNVRAIPENVDMVNIFRPSQDVPAVIDDLLEKPGVKVVWLQEGIHNEQAEKKAEDKGIKVIYNRCLMVEHMRLFGNAG